MDPQTHALQAGVDGCFSIDRIALIPIGTHFVPLLNPFNAYAGLMNPVYPNACAYHYTHPPCFGGDQKAFWNAICQAIVEAPPSQEESLYIETNFGQFGIHYSGCQDVQYDALALGWDDGVEGVRWAVTHLGPTSDEASNVWQIPNFNGQWAINPLSLLRRDNNGLMVPNTNVVYWVAFWESGGNSPRLSCADGNYYRVNWREVIPVNYDQYGSWSFTIYDDTHYLVGVQAKTFGARGNTATIPNSFLLASDCAGNPDCALCPAHGNFYVIIRGWNPTSHFQYPTTYDFPKIKPCKGGNGQC
jgi:hypothetical protein